jgi:2-polyprenyl-3-methyl-5-hydroxy-6-metoxy-1,4-benzoquinol methylase
MSTIKLLRKLYLDRDGRENFCPLCLADGSLTQRRLVQSDKFFIGRAFYECTFCEFVFDLLAEPVPDEYYNSNYVEKYDRETIGYQMRTSEAKTLSDSLSHLSIDLSTVLEIGPGPGWFMEGLLSARPNVAYDVVELSDFSAAACKNNGARNIYKANFEHFSQLSRLREKYDLVVSIHSIEHFFNPSAGLANMLRLVRPGGLIYIHTPNMKNETSGDWFHYAPEHLCFFSASTFERVQNCFGYEVLSATTLYENIDLLVLARVHHDAISKLRRFLYSRVRRVSML